MAPTKSPKKSPRAKSPGVKTPTSVRKVEGFINQIDLKPTKEIFMVMHACSLLLLMLALAAAFSWVYYVSQAIDNNAIGGPSGRGKGANEAAANAAPGETRQVDTLRVMWQGVVASSLLYFAVRHHYRSHY